MPPAARYVVQRKLGSAGPGVACYQAVQSGFERVVELRVLEEAPEADTVERFLWETRMLAGFSHPNLLDVLDSGRLEGRPFYVTPFRDSSSLDDILREGRRSQLEVARVACAISTGLAFLHARGLLHRSLALTELFFEPPLSRYYIGHFSSMSPAEGDSAPPPERLTRVPELRTQRLAEARTDVFLLGASLYTLLTGHDPLPEAVAGGRTSGPAAVPPGERVPGVSAELEAFLNKTLDLDPESRFQTAAEMAAAAEGLLKALELKALADRMVPSPPAATSRARIPVAPGAAAMTERMGAEVIAVPEPPAAAAFSRARIRQASLQGPPALPAERKRPYVIVAALAWAALLGFLTVRGFTRRETPPARMEAHGPSGEVPAPIMLATARRAHETPTDPATFGDRWGLLRRWHLGLPPGQRSDDLSYQGLLKLKIEFAQDSQAACKRLDGYLAKVEEELK